MVKNVAVCEPYHRQFTLRHAPERGEGRRVRHFLPETVRRQGPAGGGRAADRIRRVKGAFAARRRIIYCSPERTSGGKGGTDPEGA
jgi:hypothetical protein